MIEKTDSMQTIQSGSPIFPLPARVIPQPWEDISSLIVRTAAQMGYSNPLWIVRPQETDKCGAITNLCHLRDLTDYHIFHKLLALDEEVIYHCTYHRFADRLQPPEEIAGAQRIEFGEKRRPLLSYGSLVMVFQPNSSVRLCPYCLNEELPYGRIYWNFGALVVCPKHNIFLIHRCPDCHKSIPAMRPTLTHCPHCKTGDYRQSQVVIAKDSSFFHIGQQLILHHLTAENLKLEGDMALLHDSPLMALPPWKYFLLLRAFLSAIPILFPDDPFLQADLGIRCQLSQKNWKSHVFTFSEWVALTETFHYIFASWPNHYFAFLDALIRCRYRGEVASCERVDIGPFGSEWIYKNLSDPSFSFLREACAMYLKTNYPGKSWVPAPERHCVSIVQVHTTLGVHPDEIEGLVDRGLLRVAREPVRTLKKNRTARIERESVERLCREWEGLIPLYKVAHSLLNATRVTMEVLHEKRWLVLERGPNIDGYPIEMYNVVNVNAFIAAVLSRAVKASRVAGESMSLYGLSVSGIAAIEDVLDAIFEGQLIPTEAGRKVPLFQRVVLSHTDVRHWRDTSTAKNETSQFLTHEEVAKMLDVRMHVLAQITQHNLLVKEESEDRSLLLFDREKVEEFRRTYVFLHEAAAMLDLRPTSVVRYIAEGGIQSVLRGDSMGRKVRLLFRREDIRSLLF